MQPSTTQKLLTHCLLFSICLAGCNSHGPADDSLCEYRGRPVSSDINVFSIRDFGAVGDGRALNTGAFKSAVSACEQAGGGTVLVPAGRYLTGAIELKSHIQLRIDAGATLLASERESDYPLTEYPWVPGETWPSSLIYAQDAQDVTVTGRGTIDGQGASSWAPILAAKKKKSGSTTTSTATQPGAANAEDGVPPGHFQRRPNLIRFLRCTNVVVEGISLLNAPEWNIHPMMCERVRIDGVSITAQVPSPNTDGINPESCRTVQILNCRIDNGDDCITLKSGAGESGRRIGRPDEDITISNCVMYHGHGGVTIGSEMSGGVRNVVVSNCVFHGTENGIRIKSERGRGGVVEGVSVSNIVMQDVSTPFTITTFYMGKDKPGDIYPVNEGTPVFRDMLFSNITARGASSAGAITGLKERHIENLTFSNVHIEAKKGFAVTNANGVAFLDSTIDTGSGPALTLKGASDVDVTRLHALSPHAGAPLVQQDLDGK